ncbi:DUF3888 domain-containing protein [Clostridium ihumii]|uniref:DUF3888 domain-containing protein n=1 Tax=Clostridium ihumii TaxID=1470356 RepID=UPI000686B256|nr:DUF3888 domain-containing protein [Clostridium ihumii]
MKRFEEILYLIIITVYLFLNISTLNVNAEELINYKDNNNEQSQKLCHEALMSMLYPYIQSSIEKYFGTERNFDLFDANVISIKRPSEKFEFYIIIEVDTYTGAHNPPGELVRMIFKTSPYGTKLVKFQDKYL